MVLSHFIVVIYPMKPGVQHYNSLGNNSREQYRGSLRFIQGPPGPYVAEYIKIETYAGYNVQDIIKETRDIHDSHGIRDVVHLRHITAQHGKSR